MSTLQKPHYCYKCKTKQYDFDIDKHVNKYYKLLAHGYVRKSIKTHIPDVIVAICLYYFYYFIQQNQNQIYNTFEEMGLKKALISAIVENGLGNACSHKQVGIVPIIQMRDTILMQYHSVPTCKSTITTCIIGILQRITLSLSQCQAIILSPTVELATEIKNVVHSLNKYLKATININTENIECSSVNFQILIATQETINIILSKNPETFNCLKLLLITEIDTILSKGMEDILLNMLQRLPSNIQFISTTSTDNVIKTQTFTNKFMCNPLEINFETNIDESFQSFDDMNLNENIHRGIYAYGFEKPSRIQQIGIAAIIKKYNLLVQSQSGTGKTATYCVGALQQIGLNESQCQVLIITPVRELALCVRNMCQSLGCYMKNLTTHAVMGGNRIRNDILKLRNGVQIVVGTAGRILDMINRNVLKLNKLKLWILDEMDELLARGFEGEITDIYQHIPANTQICVFSATMPNELLKLTDKWMENCAYILVKKKELSLNDVKQYYIAVEKEDYKLATLCDLFEILELKLKTIIYCNTRRKVMWLGDKMCQHTDIFTGQVLKMHGDMYAVEREKTMKTFRDIKDTVLVTTDLLSRDIDVKNALFVVNYDLPMNRENYIQRVGRIVNTYGNRSVVINFVTDEYEPMLRDIESFYHTKIDELPMEVEEIMCQHPNHETLLE